MRGRRCRSLLTCLCVSKLFPISYCTTGLRNETVVSRLLPTQWTVPDELPTLVTRWPPCWTAVKALFSTRSASMLERKANGICFFFCQRVSIEQLFFVSLCFIFRPRSVEPTQNSRLTFWFCWKELCAIVRGGRRAIGVVVWCDCVASKWFRRVVQVHNRKQVNRSSFPTQCYVDVHRSDLYVWIIHIITDNSERHMCLSV